MCSNDESMVWAGMGLGKTITTLSTIDWRMRSNQVEKTLIFGPLRVIHTVWEKEARKWEHTKHFRFQIIHGTVKQREQKLFNPHADIYLINYENMAWLAEILDFYFLSKHKNLPFQMVAYDEITNLKKSTSVRMKKWEHLLDNFKYRSGLTGTPAENGYIDLHGQYLAIDNGKRLGKFVTHFRENYFARNWNGRGYKPTPLGVKQIEHQIKDITINIESKNNIKLPEHIVNDIMIDLPSTAREQYEKLERKFFVELDNDNVIEVFNKASLSNKCLQFCNGSPYLNPKRLEWYPLHDAKLQALESILEEAGGNPVIVAYSFRADAERIEKKFKKYKPVNLTKTPAKKLNEAIKRINNGEHQIVIGHPKSMGYGIDELQQTCHIGVWFGLSWHYGWYLQFIGRYCRQGQTKTTITNRLLCNNTMDEIVRDSLRDKNTTQDNLKKSIQRYRDKKTYNFW